jgi:hypothetical protein
MSEIGQDCLDRWVYPQSHPPAPKPRRHPAGVWWLTARPGHIQQGWPGAETTVRCCQDSRNYGKRDSNDDAVVGRGVTMLQLAASESRSHAVTP